MNGGQGDLCAVLSAPVFAVTLLAALQSSPEWPLLVCLWVVITALEMASPPRRLRVTRGLERSLAVLVGLGVVLLVVAMLPL